MTSVVIAAHNEAAVIGRCLDAIIGSPTPDGQLEIVVVANGCTDGTADAARRPGVTVVDLPTPGKANALNVGDSRVRTFPRIYLDADVILSPNAIGEIARSMEETGALAAVPVRRMVLRGRPLSVRAYYAIQSRLPAALSGLYGRGAIALSEKGRARFDDFPDATADDLFLDSLFADDERQVVTTATTHVAAPMRGADLVRRLVRVRAGNAAMRESSARVRRSSNTSWLTDVVVRRPWLAPAAAWYVAITLAAEVRARRMRRDGAIAWTRDQSTRSAP